MSANSYTVQGKCGTYKSQGLDRDSNLPRSARQRPKAALCPNEPRGFLNTEVIKTLFINVFYESGETNQILLRFYV